MVLSMMLGIHAYEEFAMHVRAALDGPPESRLTPDDIKEVIMMAAIYCGVPVANHAFGIATAILREKGLLPAAARRVTRARRGVRFALLLPLLLAAQPVATDSYLPALPAIARDLGSASTSLTVFVLAFGFGAAAVRPAVRPLRAPPGAADRPRLLCAGGAGLRAVRAAIPMLVACRALQGFSMAAILVCARAAVRDLYPAHEGPHVMARGLTGLGVVALLAPLLGAWMVQCAGWRWVLGGMAVYAFVLLAAVLARLRRDARPRAPARRRPRGSLREVFASASFRAWASLAAATYGGLFCFLLLSPMVYIGYLGFSPAWYGWIPAGGSLVYIFSTTLCRRLLRRMGAVRTVQLGALLSLAGPLVQALGCWLLPLLGLAAAAGPCDLLHRPRHPPALRPGRRGRRPAAPGGARGVVVRLLR